MYMNHIIYRIQITTALDFSEESQLGPQLSCIVWFQALPRVRNTPLLTEVRPNQVKIGIHSQLIDCDNLWYPQMSWVV